MYYQILVDVDSSHEKVNQSSSTSPPDNLDTTQLYASNMDTSLFPFSYPHLPLLQKHWSQILVLQLICTPPFI